MAVFEKGVSQDVLLVGRNGDDGIGCGRASFPALFVPRLQQVGSRVLQKRVPRRDAVAVDLTWGWAGGLVDPLLHDEVFKGVHVLKEGVRLRRCEGMGM